MTDATDAKQPAAPDPDFSGFVADAMMASGRIPDADGGVKAIADLTRQASNIEIDTLLTDDLGEGLPRAVPILIDHRPNGQVRAVKDIIETYRLRPERRVGVAQVATLESFNALANRHKTAHSAIFAAVDWPNPSLTAVIDYHKLDGEPAHLKHRVVYPFPVTEEFSAWIDNDGEMMEQGPFAAFLEEHAAELSAPFDAEAIEFEGLFKVKMAAPNELIALSRDLEIHVNARVKRQERLSSGERIVEFGEEHLNGAGEKVTIPGVFMISVPAFIDGDSVRIPARLRYRVVGGTIKWAYQLWRWRHWLRQQVKQDMLAAAKATGLPAYEGAPEA